MNVITLDRCSHHTIPLLKKTSRQALPLWGIAMSALLLAGCGQSSNLQHKPIEATTQIQTLRPAEQSQQAITAYRTIFIDNLNRAKNGVEQLKSEQLKTQQIKPTSTPTAETDTNPSPLTSFNADEAGSRYDLAINALYADSPLSQPIYTTLMDMATFVPDVFKDKALNQRLQTHDPALARLVNQHLIWRQQQITAEAQLKANELAQKQRDKDINEQLDMLNKTIAGYDKQIASYQALAKAIQTNSGKTDRILAKAATRQ